MIYRVKPACRQAGLLFLEDPFQDLQRELPFRGRYRQRWQEPEDVPLGTIDQKSLVPTGLDIGGAGHRQLNPDHKTRSPYFFDLFVVRHQGSDLFLKDFSLNIHTFQ